MSGTLGDLRMVIGARKLEVDLVQKDLQPGKEPGARSEASYKQSLLKNGMVPIRIWPQDQRPRLTVTTLEDAAFCL